MRTQAFTSLAPTLAALLLLPLAWTVSQEPAPKQDPPKPAPKVDRDAPLTPDGQFFGTEALEGEDASLGKRMKGLWKITEVTSEDWPKEGLDLLGYLLVTEHFMSMELQAYWDETLEDAPGDAFETFTAEFRSDKSGRVEARILLGSYIRRDNGRLEWYQSAQPRRFNVKLLGKDSLLLEWSETRSMTLTRQRHSQKAQRDFFGGLNPDKTQLNDFYNDEDLFEDDEFEAPEEEPEAEDDDF